MGTFYVLWVIWNKIFLHMNKKTQACFENFDENHTTNHTCKPLIYYMHVYSLYYKRVLYIFI